LEERDPAADVGGVVVALVAEGFLVAHVTRLWLVLIDLVDFTLD